MLYKTHTLDVEFKRITFIDQSIKAFKLLYDLNLYDVLIEDKEIFFLFKNSPRKEKLKNLIFNHVLIWEYANSNFVREEWKVKGDQKHLLYKETISTLIKNKNYHKNFTSNNLERGIVSSKDELIKVIKLMKYDYDVERKLVLRKIMLSCSMWYCSEYDCAEKPLEQINTKMLKDILFQLLTFV